MAWTTPGTAVAGDVLTAAFWNEQVRDQFDALAPFFGAWEAWTPNVRQNGARTSTVDADTARYLQVGKLVIGRANINITQSGSAGNAICTNLPVAPAFTTGDYPAGTFVYFRTGVTRYVGSCLISTFGGSSLIFHINAATAIGSDPSFATSNGDELNISFMYEAA